MTPEELRERVAGIVWHHAIDLGDGVVTPGRAGLHVTSEPPLPDFSGRTVLDIGAWDGYYSFLAERRGAKRVVAVDHYAWGVDLAARSRYWDECRARGELPDLARDEADFWRDDLPGRRGFDLAKEVLGSTVEPVVGDFMTLDLDALGVFDVVLYLGVLYHMKEPLAALERVRRVTGEVAVVETEGMWFHGLEEQGVAGFFTGDELNADFGNWYAPNERALHGMCRAAGFRRVETVIGPPSDQVPSRWRRLFPGRGGGRSVPRALHYRLVVHAYP